jgi:hypothetical protein
MQRDTAQGEMLASQMAHSSDQALDGRAGPGGRDLKMGTVRRRSPIGNRVVNVRQRVNGEFRCHADGVKVLFRSCLEKLFL